MNNISQRSIEKCLAFYQTTNSSTDPRVSRFSETKLQELMEQAIVEEVNHGGHFCIHFERILAEAPVHQEHNERVQTDY